MSFDNLKFQKIQVVITFSALEGALSLFWGNLNKGTSRDGLSLRGIPLHRPPAMTAFS